MASTGRWNRLFPISPPSTFLTSGQRTTILGAFTIITVMLVMVGVLPIWPWSRGWTWRPVIIAAGILLVVLLFAKRI